MPAYNEEATIVRAVERVLEADLPVQSREVVVVENGSSDGTAHMLEAADFPDEVRVVSLAPNRGKGGAIRAGLTEARGDYTALIDGDLEYDPNDLADMLPPLLAGDAGAVFGTRMFQAHSAYGFWYVIGNRVINLAANVLYNAWLSDFMVCLKAMPTDLLRSLELREPGFAVEAEITARLLRRKIRIYEVPVTYRARSREEGKKLYARDGARMLATLLRCRLD